MNFHKTIGFLATLLLMVGFGVPDSFAQADVKSITLSINKSTLRDSTTTPVTVTVTVGVTLTKKVGADSVITVQVSATDDDSYEVTPIDIEVTVDEGKDSKSGVQMPLVFNMTTTGELQGDADTVDEKVTVTAEEDEETAEDRPKATRTITVTDHAADLADDAETPRGIRVIITAPAANAYAPTGKDKIKVQVLRRNGLAKEFGSFSNIKVSLYNDPDKDGAKTEDDELYSLDIIDPVQLGSLAVPRIKKATLTGTRAAAAGDNRKQPHADTKAYYTRRAGAKGYDKLEFRFRLEAGGGPYEYVYAVATFGLTNAPAGTVDKLESRDTETSIYPPDPSALPEVGNGRHIKIDATLPATGTVSGITIQIGDADPIASDLAADANADAIIEAKAVVGIGKKVKISATMADFGEHTLQFVVIGRDGKSFDVDDGDPVWVTAGAGVSPPGKNEVRLLPQVVSGYAKTFDALTVIGATSQGDPLEDEFTVRAGQFKRKANLADHPDDKFEKGDLYEDDNVIVHIRAVIEDRAGNKGNQDMLSPPFILDSRPPKVTIQYPKPSATDSARFTAGVTQDYEFLGDDLVSQKLKPLKFIVDEETTTEWVLIGTDTLVVKEGDIVVEATLDGDANLVGYDLTEADTNPALKNLEPDKDDNPTNKHPAEDADAGGSNVALQVVVKDLVGNKGTGTPDGQAIFDPNAPVVNDLFPNNDALADYDNKIGGPEQTQHPIFSITEKADSILVRFEGDRRLSVAGTVAQLSMVNENIRVSFLGDNALVDGESYDLQVYVRDLAHNVGLSNSDSEAEVPQSEIGLTFVNDLDNPDGGGFEIVSEVRDNTLAKSAQSADDYAKMDSVVAGQALRLTIIAIDTMLTRQSGETRPAITYNKAGVKVVATGSDGSVSYWGSGVTDNGDGSATLDGAGWAIGTRKIFVASKAAGTLSFAVKDMTAEGVLNFMGTKEGVVVDAADFAKILLTAWEADVDGPATQVWGDFDLRMVPTDQFGNASLKTFFDQTPGTKEADSLNILDTRLKNKDNTAQDYGDGVDIQLQATPPLGGLLNEVWGVGSIGHSLTVTAPDRSGASVTIQARVRSSSIDDGDARSENNRGSLALTISPPLMPVLTLWVPGTEGDQAGNDVVIPAGDDGAKVTVKAEGYAKNSMVTFTLYDNPQDKETNDDGVAELNITRRMPGTVTVSATDGQYAADLTIVFVAAPVEEGRKAYVDASGDPVYLIGKSSGTVGVDDFLALVAAFGSSTGDAAYNPQADINDDGTVGVDDFLAFIGSFGKTAAVSGKPIVLLPGINENAEFSLSLGSDRVVAGELMAVDVSLANVEALIGYGFALNYDADKFEFVSVASADEDLLTSTGGETLFHHVVADGQISVATGMYNGTAVSGGGDIVQFVFRVLYEFEDNARFEIADGLVFDPSQLQNPAVVAGVLELQSTPREFALHQNFPNPFNPDTTIKYDLSESADVTLQIYNVLGQVVRTLVASEAQNAGRYQIRWNGMDDRGVSVSSGIYFYRISAGEFQNVRKLMLLK